MQKAKPANVRIKRAYLDWLLRTKRLSVKTVDKAAASRGRWFKFIKGADLRLFHTEKAVAFERRLETGHGASGGPLLDTSRYGI